MEAEGIAHLLSQSESFLLGQVLGEGTAGHSSGLRNGYFGLLRGLSLEEVFSEYEGHFCALATACLSSHNQHSVPSQKFIYLLCLPVNGKLLLFLHYNELNPFLIGVY